MLTHALEAEERREALRAWLTSQSLEYGPVPHEEIERSLVVDGDIMLDGDLDVSAAEETIIRSVHALRQRGPKIEYVCLTPVAKARPSRAARRRTGAARGG